MKKLIFFCCLVFTISLAQSQIADTLIRSTGFFVSPAYTGLHNTLDSVDCKPQFGLSAGYRFVNKLKYGFFIESGINYTLLGAKYPKETQTVEAYGRSWTYSQESIAHQMFLSVPFLAGYKTEHGKVRFQTSIGFSFDLQFSNYEMRTISGQYPFGIAGKRKIGDVFGFGAGFSSIFKAGISIPVTKRMCIDILPAVRYHCLSFTKGSMDIIESSTFEHQKWSAGIDIGIVWALDNCEREDFEEIVVEKSQDYTFQYKPDDKQTLVKKKVKPWGYKNYMYLELVGNGLVYSVNYERNVFQKGLASINARAGYGFTPNNYAFPVGVNVLLGKGTKKFEVGAYATFEDYLLNEFNVNFTPALAFRWVSREHFFLRLSVMGNIMASTGEIFPGFGLSIGGGF
ncbi:MAG: hypothetical protein WCQ95_13210 [Bacteroidota bacterium]